MGSAWPGRLLASQRWVRNLAILTTRLSECRRSTSRWAVQGSRSDESFQWFKTFKPFQAFKICRSNSEKTPDPFLVFFLVLHLDCAYPPHVRASLCSSDYDQGEGAYALKQHEIVSVSGI
jgi:hypothetical protein